MTTLDEAAALAAALWDDQAVLGQITRPTAALYRRNLGTFVRFAAAHGASELDEVTPDLCSAWINARISAKSPGSRARAGDPAALQTRRNRQVTLRRAVAFWKDRGWITVDLLPDVVYAPPARLAPTPLTPPEVRQLQLSGRVGIRDSFYPAVVAGGLAGASQADLARLVVADFLPDSSLLRLGGRGQRSSRTVPIGPWACDAFASRAEELQRAARRGRQAWDPSTTPLTMRQSLDKYQAQSLAPAVAANLHRALAAAGIDRANVRPASLQSYAANRQYAITQRVEDVADLLGLRSLDRARVFIDDAWQQVWANAARQDQG